MFEQEVEKIQTVIANYFEGIFYGDVKKLESAFHPQCLLIGDINGEPYYKNLQEYLAGVKNRKSPKVLGEDLNMKVLGIEILNSIAYIKLHVPMLGYNYYDYISMSKIHGEWLIVNKMFTNVKV